MRTRAKAKKEHEQSLMPPVEETMQIDVEEMAPAPVKGAPQHFVETTMDTAFTGDAPSRAFSTQKIVETLLEVLDSEPRHAFYWAGMKPLATLARVNKFISPLALAQLWRVVTDLDNLLRVLPKDLIWIPKSDWILEPDCNLTKGGKCRQLRRAKPIDMERYLYYSQFIEVVNLLDDDFVLKSDGLDIVLDFVRSTRSQKAHFPKLTELSLPIISWPPVVNFIDYFRCPNLESLEIFGERVYTWSEEADLFVDTVPKLFPGLKHLDISGRLPYDARMFVEGLKPGLSKCRKLEAISLEVTENTLEYIFNDMGAPPSLKQLHLSVCRGEDAPGGEGLPSDEHSESDLDEMDLDIDMGPSSELYTTTQAYWNARISAYNALGGAFLAPAKGKSKPKTTRKRKPKNLKRLVLSGYCHAPLVTALEEVKENKIELENVAIMLRGPLKSTQINELFKALVQSCPKAKIINIDDTEAEEDQGWFFEEAIKKKALNQYIIPPTDLMLFSKLKQLTTLNLRTTAVAAVTPEVLDTLAKSCPNLDYCSLSPSNRITTKGQKQVTLLDVFVFVTKLPKLDHLCISFDARVSPSTAMTAGTMDAVSMVLKDFNVGSSFINDAPYVTTLICGAFPALKSLEWENYESAKTVRMSSKEDELWKEVKRHVLPFST